MNRKLRFFGKLNHLYKLKEKKKNTKKNYKKLKMCIENKNRFYESHHIFFSTVGFVNLLRKEIFKEIPWSSIKYEKDFF